MSTTGTKLSVVLVLTAALLGACGGKEEPQKFTAITTPANPEAVKACNDANFIIVSQLNGAYIDKNPMDGEPITAEFMVEKIKEWISTCGTITDWNLSSMETLLAEYMKILSSTMSTAAPTPASAATTPKLTTKPPTTSATTAAPAPVTTTTTGAAAPAPTTTTTAPKAAAGTVYVTSQAYASGGIFAAKPCMPGQSGGDIYQNYGNGMCAVVTQPCPSSGRGTATYEIFNNSDRTVKTVTLSGFYVKEVYGTSNPSTWRRGQSLPPKAVEVNLGAGQKKAIMVNWCPFTVTITPDAGSWSIVNDVPWTTPESIQTCDSNGVCQNSLKYHEWSALTWEWAA